ncbi:MAG: hypothetical protein AAF901_03250 [Bacteroidota bacterium]
MSQSRTDKFQTTGTILALVISIIAMITSIYEANIMKSQQKAMVWPYIKAGEVYNSEGFNVKVYNNGTGPAIIKSIEVTYKDHLIKDVNQLLDSLRPGRTFGYDIVINNDINNYVFKSGEEVIVFGFTWNPETREAINNIQYVDMKIAYESVLGDQWLYDSKKDTHEKDKEFKARIEYNKD